MFADHDTSQGHLLEIAGRLLQSHRAEKIGYSTHIPHMITDCANISVVPVAL